MTHLKAPVSDSLPSTPGKSKSDRSSSVYYTALNRFRFNPMFGPRLVIWSIIFLFLIIFCLFLSTPASTNTAIKTAGKRRNLKTVPESSGREWDNRVITSARPSKKSGFSILVTGAAGFVGTHVSLALKKRGDGVIGLDNFNSYYEIGLKNARKSLIEKAGVFIIEGDINDSELLFKLFNLVKFTHVMHLAAQAGVRYAMKNPYSYIHSNINGFVTLLEVCKSANPQPIMIWASSSSVYGLNSKVPFSENDRTDQPASLYAATKKAGEEIAHSYNHIYGLSITGLRFFTVYGPWGRPDMAYYFFTKDILRGKEIKIYESVDQRTVARDFTYIDDVVKGCLSALDTAKKSTGSGGKKKGNAELRIYNLGNTKPVPIKKVVSVLEKLLKKKSKKKALRMPRNGDVVFTHANISLAERDLGYHPRTDLETGLKKFVKWYVEYYGSKKRFLLDDI